MGNLLYCNRVSSPRSGSHNPCKVFGDFQIQDLLKEVSAVSGGTGVFEGTGVSDEESVAEAGWSPDMRYFQQVPPLGTAQNSWR